MPNKSLVLVFWQSDVYLNHQIDMSDVIDNAAQMVHDNGLSDGTCGVGVYVGVWLCVSVSD